MMENYEKILKVEEKDGVLRLSFSGEMTIYTAAQIKDELIENNALLVNEANNIEIDVSGVSEFDTSGLQLIMMTKRKLVSLAKKVALVGHSDAVMEAIRLYKMDEQIESDDYDDDEIEFSAG